MNILIFVSIMDLSNSIISFKKVNLFTNNISIRAFDVLADYHTMILILITKNENKKKKKIDYFYTI